MITANIYNNTKNIYNSGNNQSGLGKILRKLKAMSFKLVRDIYGSFSPFQTVKRLV